jgi:cobalt-zinc-cadmium efflux system membrane fusion protein
MLFGFWRPASRRKFVAIAGLLLVAGLAWAATALAHEGQDHDPTPPTTRAAGGKPRLAIQSEAYQVVAILDGQRLTI